MLYPAELRDQTDDGSIERCKYKTTFRIKQVKGKFYFFQNGINLINDWPPEQLTLKGGLYEVFCGCPQRARGLTTERGTVEALDEYCLS